MIYTIIVLYIVGVLGIATVGSFTSVDRPPSNEQEK